jgi:hypothetical protein
MKEIYLGGLKLLKVEEHENYINDLTNLLTVEGVDSAKVSTILQGLRENYTEVSTSFNDTTKKMTDFTKLNEDLRNANMMLLSKLGSQNSGTKPHEEHKEEHKETPNEETKAMTLEELTKNYI